MKRNVSFYLINLLLLFVFAVPGFAQTGVGKLSGKVTDADTREPLIGANLLLVNTTLGTATDISGEYFILNITPGNYDVKISYVGYAPKTIANVRIVPGITYELNIELSTDFTLPEIVVEGRKFFEAKSTGTTKIIDADEINRLPVKGVENLAALQAGVVKSEGSGGADGNATINVRGGRGGEVLYIVDGVPQNDVYTGANYSQVSNSAIDQLSFQIGGYEAKYGQAQSGIVNVTTKSGSPLYGLFVDVISSSFTDDFGYNLYTMNLSGPFIPGVSNHTFFLSGERGWNADNNPRAIGNEFQSIGYQSDKKRDLESSVWRLTARTTHILGDFALRLGANFNNRDAKGYVHSYAKANSAHNPLTKRDNLSLSGKLSQNISNNAFWNLNVGYRVFNQESGDGVWFDNLDGYGDSVLNAQIGITLPNNGGIIPFDEYGIFAKNGRVNNAYSKRNNNTLTVDADLTAQLMDHLMEFGGGFNTNTVRLFSIGPRGLSADNIRNLPIEEKYRRLQPTAFGYDITGRTKVDDGDYAAKTPMFAYAYVQDRFELEDMVLNIGLRLDYFDTKAEILRDPSLPFAEGDPNAYDAADFVTKKSEVFFSPRIGLGFPVTQSTVFHAQYGKFTQQPSLDQLYTTIYDLNFLITDDNWRLNTGHVNSEVTTQYEIGFRQIIDNKASLNITAFYKNTEGLVNTATVFFYRTPGGQMLRYITPTNTDFGTIKGVALSLDISRISYFSLSADYTYSIAEGTGSSTSSSFTAAFRNTNGEIPKVIAPLDFDQRHTGVINVDFYVPKGDLGFFELTSANILINFASGRPYTPIESQSLLEGSTNWGNTKGYVNSAYGPGTFKVDLKVEKSFAFGKALITPYLWVENVFDSDNPVAVYQSTGDAYSTGFLSTENGKKLIQDRGIGFKYDYESLERNPFNFGIPRLIKVGLKVNFSGISL
ncbi:MAG: TonB-dependent receptor [Ignavibacteria bacterium]|nr:TonB-dependent receptor [Ignavibacteria bacterium]